MPKTIYTVKAKQKTQANPQKYATWTSPRDHGLSIRVEQHIDSAERNHHGFSTQAKVLTNI